MCGVVSAKIYYHGTVYIPRKIKHIKLIIRNATYIYYSVWKWMKSYTVELSSFFFWKEIMNVLIILFCCV
jgi:hypothetical protein